MKDLENEDKVYELSYKADEGMISQVLESNAQPLNTEKKFFPASGRGPSLIPLSLQQMWLNPEEVKKSLEK